MAAFLRKAFQRKGSLYTSCRKPAEDPGKTYTQSPFTPLGLCDLWAGAWVSGQGVFVKNKTNTGVGSMWRLLKMFVVEAGRWPVDKDTCCVSLRISAQMLHKCPCENLGTAKWPCLRPPWGSWRRELYMRWASRQPYSTHVLAHVILTYPWSRRCFLPPSTWGS